MILKYSNGWGHLIMSLVVMGVGMYLYNVGAQGVGIGLISLVTAAWFVPGAAKQVAVEVKEKVEEAKAISQPLPRVSPLPSAQPTQESEK